MAYQDERMLKMMEQLPQNQDASGYNAVVPVVEWEFSQTGDPTKDRRKNIKNAIKALKPVKRWFAVPGWGMIPLLGRTQWKYSDGNRCVIDGCDCSSLDYGELWNTYFRDENTGAIRPFRPWTKVLPGQGTQLSGTYCPQHMQLYHFLMTWIEQEAAESDKGFFKRMKAKGVAFVPIRREEVSHQDPLIHKWEQAFIEAQKDGLPIVHYKNPITGENDITMIVFDNRILRSTPERANTLSGRSYVDKAQETEVN